jgi:DNA-binding NarL/FixJ family response regulator
VVERLLAPGRQLDAEVLVVTGGVQDADVARLHKLGVKEIVQKADGIDAVVEAIGKAMARQRAD